MPRHHRPPLKTGPVTDAVIEKRIRAALRFMPQFAATRLAAHPRDEEVDGEQSQHHRIGPHLARHVCHHHRRGMSRVSHAVCWPDLLAAGALDCPASAAGIRRRVRRGRRRLSIGWRFGPADASNASGRDGVGASKSLQSFAPRLPHPRVGPRAEFRMAEMQRIVTTPTKFRQPGANAHKGKAKRWKRNCGRSAAIGALARTCAACPRRGRAASAVSVTSFGKPSGRPRGAQHERQGRPRRRPRIRQPLGPDPDGRGARRLRRSSPAIRGGGR